MEHGLATLHVKFSRVRGNARQFHRIQFIEQRQPGEESMTTAILLDMGICRSAKVQNTTA